MRETSRPLNWISNRGWPVVRMPILELMTLPLVFVFQLIVDFVNSWLEPKLAFDQGSGG
jgi:hypothetical protein